MLSTLAVTVTLTLTLSERLTTAMPFESVTTDEGIVALSDGEAEK